MSSSSAYAAPLLIDLAPSRVECVLLVVAFCSALAALAITSLALAWLALFGLLCCLFLARAWHRIRRRPAQLMLFSDGLAQSHSAHARVPAPAELLQATWFGPIPHLRFRILDSAQTHAIALFPDRLDAHTRHRLRVWLATHRPHRFDAAVDDAGKSA